MLSRRIENSIVAIFIRLKWQYWNSQSRVKQFVYSEYRCLGISQESRCALAANDKRKEVRVADFGVESGTELESVAARVGCVTGAYLQKSGSSIECHKGRQDGRGASDEVGQSVGEAAARESCRGCH